MQMVWYYIHQGVQYGPLTWEQVQQAVVAGRLAPGDLIWRQGMAQWVEAQRVPELVGLFRSVPVPTARTAPAAIPSRSTLPTGFPAPRPGGYGGLPGPQQLPPSPWDELLLRLLAFLRRQGVYWQRLFHGYPQAIAPLPQEQQRLAQADLSGRLANYALWRRAVLGIACGFMGAAAAFQFMHVLSGLVSDGNQNAIQYTRFGTLIQFLMPLSVLAVAIAAFLAVNSFERLRFSFIYVIGGGIVGLSIPLIVVFIPSEWLIELDKEPQTTVREFEVPKNITIPMISIRFHISVMPLVLSLLPALSRGCLRIKLFFPAAIAPGWGMIASIPLLASLTLATFVLVYHLVGNLMLLISLALWIGAPLIFLFRFNLLTRPLNQPQDVAQIVKTQYVVMALAIVAILLFVIYLSTAKPGDRFLVGIDKKTSWIRPWDLQLHFSWIEYVGRLLFYSTLFADLMLIVTQRLWYEERVLRLQPGAEEFDQQMLALAKALALPYVVGQPSPNSQNASASSPVPGQQNESPSPTPGTTPPASTPVQVPIFPPAVPVGPPSSGESA